MRLLCLTPVRPVPGGWQVCQAPLVQMVCLAEMAKTGSRERKEMQEIQVKNKYITRYISLCPIG